MDFSGLPGADLIAQGLRDLADGRESEAALLVLIGARRLRAAGIDVPQQPLYPDVLPEHRLYAALAATDQDSAHSRYNALVRRLVSFERAAACVS